MLTQPSPNDLMSMRQVAELLDCTDRHVRQLIASGKLPANKVGGGRMVRIWRSDVLALLSPIPTTADQA